MSEYSFFFFYLSFKSHSLLVAYIQFYGYLNSSLNEIVLSVFSQLFNLDGSFFFFFKFPLSSSFTQNQKQDLPPCANTCYSKFHPLSSGESGKTSP